MSQAQAEESEELVLQPDSPLQPRQSLELSAMTPMAPAAVSGLAR